ncbi:unnamed protein product [Rangifer tarandus platyrhynchus]|uniref:Uncharacterized protein n=1 Tax=Rangifer tarandus platyrhynchus TaxID=3082113 RepID=A0AC59ZMF8_RANTA
MRRSGPGAADDGQTWMVSGGSVCALSLARSEFKSQGSCLAAPGFLNRHAPQPKQRARPGHTPGLRAALDLGRPQAGRGLDGPAGQGTQRQPAGVEARRVLVAISSSPDACQVHMGPMALRCGHMGGGGGYRGGWGSGHCEGQGGLTLESV